MGLCSKYEGWCWDHCLGYSFWRGFWDRASWASETVCNLLYGVCIKVHHIVNGCDPLIYQLHYCLVRYSHLYRVLKERRCLSLF